MSFIPNEYSFIRRVKVAKLFILVNLDFQLMAVNTSFVEVLGRFCIFLKFTEIIGTMCCVKKKDYI